MKRSPRPTRPASNLSEPAYHQLNMYALAASAAGVSFLALVQPAEARIVYTSVHHVLARNKPYNLDLNHDGIADFWLTNFYQNTTGGGPVAVLWAGVLSKNEIWRTHTDWCAALSKGVRVGPKGSFAPHSSLLMAFVVPPSSHGPWIGNRRAYVGLKFSIKEKIHFGWARFDVTTHRTPTAATIHATLTGYAYETIPNKPILTGKTTGQDDASVEVSKATPTKPTRKAATLGLLAVGSPGLSIWRRDEPTDVTEPLERALP